MAERRLPDLIEAWLEYMQHSDVPKTYQRWAFCSVIAGALERRVWLIRDHDTGWYPNLYLFLIGPPGSGKSTVAEAAMQFLREVPDINFLAGRINGVSLFHDLTSIGKKKRFEWNGESYAHSAATLFASEAQQTFAEQYKGGSIIGALTDLYNGGNLGWSNTHGEGRSTRFDGQVVCYNPCINLLACSTPEWLITRCMTKQDAEGGFGSRILLIVSKEDLKGATEWETAHAAKDMRLRSAIIEDLKQVAKLKGPYFSSESFREEWKRCQAEYETWRERRKQSGIMGGYQQRKMTQLYKLTMILAAARRNDLVLHGEDIRDAWSMLNEIEQPMIEVLDELEISHDAKIRREIMAYLKARNRHTILRSEILGAFPKFKFQDLSLQITALVQMGRLAIAEERPGRTLYHVLG